ncbi:class I SAM-dependent methyltransferase [Allosediminivita pacifica]|uniref:Nodulation protein S (NodS) n=1 Tax=Allosediminivita pacifica TaxID=1267769 RepID=A0A2T5ZYW1_9RHOB|nr:class I SAM-dependent methyltransferase [Allosediminivita pacifica]PTX36744.1 nodulation protein S (NodS) [Allosediminivita pacifica]GGB30492.1 methyltransferase [Allosediminivita pacifica]
MSERVERWEATFAAGRDPWDFWSTPYEQEKFRACTRLLQAGPYQTALEIGCAGGAFTKHLAQRCNEILALDISKAALAQARRRLPEPQVTFARAELPQDWPAGHFDLIVFSEVLYYFTRAEITELARRAEQSLRPGGQILLVNWLGETGEPLSGREAAELFLGACCESVPGSRPQARAPYRVDLLTRTHRTS